MKGGISEGLTLPGSVKHMITTSYVIRNALSLKLLFKNTSNVPDTLSAVPATNELPVVHDSDPLVSHTSLHDCLRTCTWRNIWEILCG